MSVCGASCGRLIALVMAIGLVAGCDTLTNTLGDTFQGAIRVSCPSANIIADASRRLAYRPGPGRDITDIDSEITMDWVGVTCDSDINRDTLSGTVEATVSTDFTVSRGPANRSRQVPFQFFVSVTDLADKVLYREAFSGTVGFRENETRRAARGEPVVLEIPIRSGQSGQSYRILVGLVINREQLEMNRRDRRPRL